MKNTDIIVELVNGKSKKTGKDYKAIKLTIGDWSTFVFPRSPFELNYIEKVLNANE